MANEVRQKLGFDAKDAINALNRLTTAVKTANMAMVGMAGNKANLGPLSNQFNKAGNSAKGAGAKVSGFLQAFTGINPITDSIRALAVLLREALVASTQFGLKIAEIQTIGGQAAASTAAVSSEILKLSSAYGIAADKVAEGLYQTLSNQVGEASKAMGFLNESLRLAKVTAAPPAAAINALSSVLNVYGKENINASQAADTLFKTVEYGRLRLEDVGNILGRVLPLTSAMGVGFDEAAAAIAVMTRQGVKADTAVTQLRAIMQKIIKPTEEMNKLFHRWGVRDGKDAIETSGSLFKMLQRMSKEVGGSNAEMAKFFRRVRAVVGQMSIMTNEGKLMIDTMGKMDEAGGSVAAAWEKFKAVDAQKLTQAWAEWKNTIIELGQAMGPTVLGVIKGTKIMLEALSLTVGYIANAMNPLRKDTQKAKQIVTDLNKTIEDNSRKVARVMTEEYKNGVTNALKSMADLKREWLNLQDSTKSSIQRTTAVFADFLDQIADAYRDTVTGLDKTIKGVSKVREEQAKKIEDIEASAEQRSFDRRFRNARTEYNQRQLLASKYNNLQYKALQASHKKFLSDAEQEAIEKNISAARQIAQQQELNAEQRGNRAEAQLWAGKQESLDRIAKNIANQRYESEVKRAKLASEAKIALKQDAASVKQITKSMMEQVKLRETARGRTGPSAKKEFAAAEEEIQRLTKELKTKTFTEAHKAFLKSLGVDASEMDRINEMIRDGLDVKLTKLTVDLQLIQEQLLSREFKINVAMGLDDIKLDAKALGVDIQGLDVFAAEDKVRKKAEELSAQDRRASQNEDFNIDLLKKAQKDFKEIKKDTKTFNDIGSESFSIWQVAGIAAAKVLKGTEAARAKGNEYRQEIADAENLAMGITKSYSDQETALYNMQKRIEAGKQLTLEELEGRREIVTNLKQQRAISLDGYNKLISILDVLHNEAKLTEDITKSRKEQMGDATRQVVKRRLDENIKEKKSVDDITASYDERKAKEAAVRQELFGTWTATESVKVSSNEVANRLGRARDNTNATATAMTTLGINANGAIGALSGVLNMLIQMRDTAREAAQAVAAAGSGGVSGGAHWFGGRFFNSGGFARGQDRQLASVASGESIINRKSSSRFFSQLNAMNQGSQPVYREQGGPVTNVGDVNVTVQGGDTAQSTVREVGNALRREIRRGTIKLR